MGERTKVWKGSQGKANPIPLATKAALAQIVWPLGEQRPQGKADGQWGRGGVASGMSQAKPSGPHSPELKTLAQALELST